MSPELGKGWFTVAVFIALTSACLLFIVPPNSAEFVITVTTLAIGLVFVALVVFLTRRT